MTQLEMFDDTLTEEQAARYEIRVGDVLRVCEGLPFGYFDAVLTDPPYGLSFMGKAWDHAVPGPDVWSSILATCKPGAQLVAFASTRTYHRLACSVEDAGFEVRDMFSWLYGSGFPKRHDVSKALDKRAGATRPVLGDNPNHRPNNVNYQGIYAGGNTGAPVITGPATDEARVWEGYDVALKPACEPAVVARKPLEGTVAGNVLAHGCGALNVGSCRIGDGSDSKGARVGEASASRRYTDRGVVNLAAKPGVRGGDPRGRYPSNVIVDDHVAAQLEDKAKFFYCPKPSKREREAGLAHRSARNVNDGRATSIDNPYQRGDSKRLNPHPTVKPIDLMRYLATLLLPPERETPRRLLVPFSGSGSEVIGALLAGWDHVVGIEISEEYASVARARLAHWID